MKGTTKIARKKASVIKVEASESPVAIPAEPIESKSAEILAAQNVYYGERKAIHNPDFGMRQGDGSFSLADDVAGGRIQISGWYHCRDGFHGVNANMQQMAMVHPNGVGVNIAAFIYRIEKICLKHSKLTVCGPTSQARITWIKPAEFWVRQPARRSLFTALLRAGMKYDPQTDNFEKALFNAQYIKGTKAAVKRFLDGYTWSDNSQSGWYDRFAHCRGDDLKKMLRMKPVSEKQLMDFALEQLKLNKEELISQFRKTKYGKKEEVASAK